MMNSSPCDLHCMSPILLPDEDNQLLDFGNDLEIFPEILQEFEPIFNNVTENNGDGGDQQMIVQDGSDSDSGISVISDQRDGSPLKPVQQTLEPITTEIVYENEVPISDTIVNIPSQNLNRILFPIHGKQPKQISIQNPIIFNTRTSTSSSTNSHNSHQLTDYPRNKFVQVKMEHGIQDGSADMKAIGVHTSGKRLLPEDSAKLNSILQSQVKIQPKPEMQTFIDQGYEAVYIGKESPQNSDNSSEIIYEQFSTYEDTVVDDSFNMLNESSNYINNDGGGLPSWTTSPNYNPLQIDPSCTLQPLLSASSTCSATPAINGQMQLDRMMKKQERMIKNRQAASLSRQRKKEYMERLENRVEQLKAENASLRHQNLEWRERYLELEARLREIDKQNGSSPSQKTQSSGSLLPGMKSRATLTATAATTMLAVVMLLAVNIHPALFIGNSSENYNFPDSIARPVGGLLPKSNGIIDSLSSIRSAPSGHLSRRLMSINQHQTNTTQEEPEHHPNKDYPLCHDKLYNATEAERLATELKGWAFHSGKSSKSIFLKNSKGNVPAKLNERRSNLKFDEHKFVNKPYPLTFEDYQRLKQLSKNFHSASTRLNHRKMSNINQNTVQVYNPTFDSYAEHLMSSIDRKNDTMYVVSLRNDHLVFPAIVQNKTIVIPKIAFLIPAAHGFKDSHNPEKLAMMQIECQVTNFTTVYLDKWQVPVPLRTSNDPRSGPSNL